MVDYMIWPWIERLEFLEYAKKFVFDAQKFPKLRKYAENMRQLKAVKETEIAGEVLDKFFKTMASGEPDYDLGI